MTDPAAPDIRPPDFPPPPPEATPITPLSLSPEAVRGTAASPPEAPARLTRRMARTQALASKDDKKIRKASLSVGVAVAITSGSVVLAGCLILIVMAMVNAVQVPPGFGQISNHGDIIIVRPRPRWGWLNADQVIMMVSILAIASLVLTSLVAWLMARRAVQPLAEALRLQRHFVADASHELRTPLTALSSRVQILQRRLDSGKPVGDLVQQLHNDAKNMAHVLDDMLLTVEGAPVVPGTMTSVAACLRQAVESLESLADQAKVAITCQVDADMMVSVPEASLTRAVVAVVDNAIQHSPADSTVEVSASQVEGAAIIRVIDHGSGITGVDPNHIFDRFAHGSETGRKRSFGLGLALASEVAHRFGGDIRVESTSARGTTFALSFPVLS